MAETVRIEIPVSVQDNTSAGVQSATRNMSNFERSMKRTEQQLNRMDRAHHVRVDADDQASGTINRLSSATESLDGTAADVDISANDTASQIVDQVEDQVSTLDGTAADVDVGANDAATQVVNAAGDAVENFDGQSGDAEIGADDGATPVIRAAEDAVENFDGSSGEAEISADDGATPVVRVAQDAVENFDGMSGDAEVGADDQASPVIDAARDKAESWAGSVFNATIGIIDNVTAPIQSVLRAVSNPVVQGASLLGVSLGVADTVNTFKDFESMMSQVKAISGATGQDFEDLTAKAKEMGATTKFTATQSAEAFNYMAMAGWKPTQMIDGISGIMSLAAASGEDLGTTSDIVTDAITAFGLTAGDAGHFADVLAQASANANTNVGMLGESFKYVAPVAGAMNYTVEDTSLALGLMANASVNGNGKNTEEVLLMKITHLPEDGKNFIPYEVSGKTIDFDDGELMFNVSKKERDYEVVIDICEDYTGGLVMGADAGDKYVAQIIIPAREYTEVEKENPNYDPENEEGTEQPTIKELKPVPFSMDRCELRLWEREV